MTPSIRTARQASLLPRHTSRYTHASQHGHTRTKAKESLYLEGKGLDTTMPSSTTATTSVRTNQLLQAQQARSVTHRLNKGYRTADFASAPCAVRNSVEIVEYSARRARVRHAWQGMRQYDWSSLWRQQRQDACTVRRFTYLPAPPPPHHPVPHPTCRQSAPATSCRYVLVLPARRSWLY